MSSFNSIKTSIANKEIVTELTRKLGLGPENVIARLAFSYSLSKNIKFTLKNIQDSKGKEYNKKVLFGNNFPYYLAMICTNYEIYKTDKDIPKYIKMHIDHGLELMHKEFSDSQTMSAFDFLLIHIQKGLDEYPNIV